MSLNPSAQFMAKNELNYKTPMYVVGFQTNVGSTYTITDVSSAYPIWLESTGAGFTPGALVGYTAVVFTTAGIQEERIIASNTSDIITFHQSITNTTVQVGDTFRIDFYETFCTYKPVSTAFTINEPKPYVSYISGGGYSIMPDEGSASSATVKIEMQDKDNYVTSMLHNATGRLQKKRCYVKAGYVGMIESDMLTVFTGLVTDYTYSKDGAWTFSVSDAIRALNKYVFRGASDDNVLTISGNPIDILLELLISDEGDLTRGHYDVLPSGYGLGILPSEIDIERFEYIRDTYYPTTAVTFKFDMTDRDKGSDFFISQILKPLNMYPIVRGDGRFSAQIYRPITAPYSSISINEDDMFDIPKYDGNLTDLINEVQFSYDYDDIVEDDYGKIDVFSDANSINVRGVGDRTLEMELLGLHSNITNADDFLTISANRIFNRYSNPPIKLNVKTFFKNLLIEPGDIISVSNKFLPNLDTGNFDFKNVQMEVIKRTVDWKRGYVSLSLLQTGYDKGDYAAVSPEMIVATDATELNQFTVDDVKDYLVGYKVSFYRRLLDITAAELEAAHPTKNYLTDFYHYELIKGVGDKVTFEITEIVGNLITIESGLTEFLQEDWIAVYSDEADLNTDAVPTPQVAWGYITAAGDPDPYLITP